MIDFARADYGKEERDAVKRVLDSDWLASGNENTQFEKEFAEYVGTKFAVCVNSGSSANLLALASLGLPKGAKVLTSACGFPATLAPIIHLGLEPVFVDYSLPSHNIDISQVMKKLPEVQAIIFAHTMGSPVDMDIIIDMARRFEVKVIEDCCEALGTSYKNKKVGNWGDVGTFSFYPSHQMTAGGMGGMVVTNDEKIAKTCKEFRDWGKTWDWDEKLGDNKTMYDKRLADIKYYRHYVYAQVGYNFKLAEMNAAFGREQLKKLDKFKARRKELHDMLTLGMEKVGEFILTEAPLQSDPCWFGLTLTLKKDSKIKRNEFGDYLESQGIRHRPFFAGNILRHKPFSYLKRLRYFPVAEKLMHDSLFIGCHTKMDENDVKYIVGKVAEYVDSKYSKL